MYSTNPRHAACPPEALCALSKSPAAAYISTLREVGLSFVPAERQAGEDGDRN